MKFVFLVFVVSSLLSINVHAKEIFITASAKIYSNDIVEAKVRVLKNAQLKAVKKGVELFLVKKTINENYQVISEQIYNFNQKFIRNSSSRRILSFLLSPYAIIFASIGSNE